ncbi:MAG: enolase C-terminal domain-like protein [Propionibacteriaceae bacterium]
MIVDQRITSLTANVYTVPTERPEADGTATWNSTTMIIVTVAAGDTKGVGWTYGPAAVADVVTDTFHDIVVGTDPCAIPGTWAAMVAAVRNSTRAGVCGYAVSAVDVALWDLKARLADLPLADLWGRCRPSADVYGSGGFTTFTDRQLIEQLEGWLREDAISRVKIKIGEQWGTNQERDTARIRLARRVIGQDTELYVDANGAYSVKQAVRVMEQVAAERVVWFEEPVSSDDLTGLRIVRDRVTADVTAGEYGSDATYFTRMCAAGAVDCLQIDATRAGGYTAWQQASAIAGGHQLEVSAHCAPNLHAHVGVATPNLRHLEYFSDHARIEQIMFDHTLDPADGTMTPDPTRPGHGLSFRADRADAFRVR